MKLSETIAKYERVARELESGAVGRTATLALSAHCNSALKEIAREALLLTNLDERDFIKAMAFVDSFVGELHGNVARFVLSDATEVSNRSITADDIADWVRRGFENNSQDNRDGKVFDSRDTDLDSTIRKMQGILLYGDGSASARAAAQSKYMPFIEDFITAGISEAKINEWSRTILNAWISYVSDAAVAHGAVALRRIL